MNLGQAALLIARSEIGHGEHGANNMGFHINKYRVGASPRGGGAWCATFVSWCLEQGWHGMGNTSACPVLRSNGAAQLVARCERYGRRVDFKDMQPGDVLLWKRTGGNHVNLCYNLFDKEFTTIDGNKGRFPALVKEVTHTGHRSLIKVIRLP